MPEENMGPMESATAVPAERPQKRERKRSTIQFPYNDLDDAVEVAKQVFQHGDNCGLDQLAPWMGHDSVTSGTFRLKVGAARVFGLVEVGRKRVSLTPLGRDITNPAREEQARRQAFLKVPLYNAIFERYRGHLLPPDVGLEREMAALGVAEKQTDKARQAFRRSAEQADFFKEGRDRLVLPAGVPTKEIARPEGEAQEERRKDEEDQRGSGGGGLPPGLHPFIQGLLGTLPPPGSEWPEEKRKQWLQTAESIFGLIYRDAQE